MSNPIAVIADSRRQFEDWLRMYDLMSSTPFLYISGERVLSGRTFSAVFVIGTRERSDFHRLHQVALSRVLVP